MMKFPGCNNLLGYGDLAYLQAEEEEDLDGEGVGVGHMVMKRLAKNDVRYRFVIDVGNTLAATKP
ncbi:unnamed protein product [Prunus armeniaca]